ncbi:MAG TPA: ATP-binding cassette domain-containing protein [Salinivirga sp.]|uniref:ATP-binding cassette domain-containing protein n=1 Tax=Salinivirga sp. TaxID=1970192 RepID=UPI002B495678|nr:ATP-binding cassette domain-containing protein [Salinivirga sp.]HKK58069.1 ATP-binding cassette domain-containing protein [Salinivirga sp.]
MSERILKALMQLFAIIAKPLADGSDRRLVVNSFLNQMLNQELANEYLQVYDYYYSIYQKKLSVKHKRKKSIALSSVKVLKICTEINNELTHQQKRVVLFRLLEFIKTDNEISDQELEFVETVASTFYIPDKEFIKIKAFVLYDFDRLPNSSQLLVIDNQKDDPDMLVNHIQTPGMRGQVRVFSIVEANMYVMRYIGDDELYLNGQLVQQDKVYVLTFGSSMRNSRIKPIYYSDIISAFSDLTRDELIKYDVKKVSYQFQNGNTGLHEISFTEESGNLIGIMGASGAGKSTLLNVLNGIYKPSEGEVLINGYNIHEEEDKIQGLIGYVSQDDLLIEELTVFQNLYYNALLCFGNLSKPIILKKVVTVLQNLGLYEIKDMTVGSPLNKKISGGQRKRLNIALELIREPSVLFLDEPTSGLSSRDSENIMDLLKELTLKGKLIFVVIHQPSSDIFKMFDKLLLLDYGGFMIYYGNPVDSIMYFKSRIHQADWNESECHCCGNVNSEQIFNIVEANVLDEYGNLTKTRKIGPSEWSRKFLRSDKNPYLFQEKEKRSLPKIDFKAPGLLKQFRVFVMRDVLSKFSNRQYMLINMLEAPLLAFILSFIVKFYNVDATNKLGYTLFENNNLPVYIFMSVIVAIFIGLTVSAEEIIKDRKILRRERFLNLSWFSYLTSKVAILLFISALQALLFVLVGNSVMEIPGMNFHYWLMLFSAWSVANMMGLIISDLFKTVVTIYILIPFLVIPQLILSGIIVRYDQLNPSVSSPTSIPWYGEIIAARWAYEGLAVHQYKNNAFEKDFYPYNKVMSEAVYHKDYWLKEIENKLNTIDRQLGNDETNSEKFAYNLRLVREELKKQIQENELFSFAQTDQITPDGINQQVIQNVRRLLEDMRKYYINLYNSASRQKDELLEEKRAKLMDNESFIRLKMNHANDQLSEFVRNSNSFDRIIEYNGRLYQKMDPIYKDPEPGFIRAHFYSPYKKFLGSFFPTYWVNFIVLWLMNILSFIILYKRWLVKLFAWIEKVVERVKS